MSKIVDDENKIFSQQTITLEREKLKDFEYQKFMQEKEDRDKEDGFKKSEEETEEDKKLADANANISAFL